MTSFEREEKTTMYQQTHPQGASSFAPSVPYSTTTQGHSFVVTAPQQQQQEQQQHAGHVVVPISPAHATAFHPHAQPAAGYAYPAHHAYAAAAYPNGGGGGGAFATPPQQAHAVPSSNALTAPASAPPASKHHQATPREASQEDNDQFVQEIIVDWTAELDDRLLQWARYCRYDWVAVGQNLQLPAFICEHRYDTLRRRDRANHKNCRNNEHHRHPPPRDDRHRSSHYQHHHHQQHRHHRPRDGEHREHQVLVRDKSWSTGTSHWEGSGKVLHASSTIPTTTHHRHDQRHKASVSSIVSRSNSSDTEESRRRRRMVDLFAENIEQSREKNPAKKVRLLAVSGSTSTAAPPPPRHKRKTASPVVSSHKNKETAVAASAATVPSERAASSTSRPAAKVDAVIPEVSTSAPPPAKSSSYSTSSSSHHKKAVSAVEESMSFFRLFWQGADDCLGFLTLPADATFADARTQIAEQLDGVDADYQFLLDELGPVSRKQEAKLGPIMEWLGTENVHAGSRKNPIKLEILQK